MEGSQFKDKIRIEMNKSPLINERVDYYYIEYQRIVKDILDFTSPLYHIDIHTYECLSDYISTDPILSSAESIGVQLYSKSDNILFRKLKQNIENNVSI